MLLQKQLLKLRDQAGGSGANCFSEIREAQQKLLTASWSPCPEPSPAFPWEPRCLLSFCLPAQDLFGIPTWLLWGTSHPGTNELPYTNTHIHSTCKHLLYTRTHTWRRPNPSSRCSHHGRRWPQKLTLEKAQDTPRPRPAGAPQPVERGRFASWWAESEDSKCSIRQTKWEE